VSAVEANLALQTAESGAWRPPVLKTVATTGAGVPEVIATIAAFRAQSKASEPARRRARSEYRLRELVAQQFMQHLERDILHPGELTGVVDRIAARDIDPYTAAAELLERAGLKTGPCM
jgi:LAO/AO transport system kinase